MPSGDQIVSCSWDKTIKLWEVATGFCLKTYEGHEEWIMNVDVNATGTRMISCSKGREIIYWDMNVKNEKPILSIFDEEHENVIDIIVFVPLKTAKVLVKAREQQDQGNDEQTGGNIDGEEEKEEEEKNNEDQTSTKTNQISKRGDALKKAREKLAKKKLEIGMKKEDKEDSKANDDDLDDIVVKDEYVASGSRDKRIKIWS